MSDNTEQELENNSYECDRVVCDDCRNKLLDGAYELAYHALSDIENECLEFSDSLFGPIETLKYCLNTLRTF
jgi:hypothetical protein